MRRAAAILMLGAGLSACSMAPKYVRGAAPVPPAFPTGAAYPQVGPTPQEAAADAALPSLDHREMFGDPRLQALIEQALVNNRDLRVAAANIAAARARYRVQRADRLPQLDAGVGASVTSGGRTNIGVGTVSGTRRNFSADIGITAFEIDLFGRVASLTQAEQDRYFSSEAAARATRLALVGDIVDAWLTHGADASLLKIASDTAANAGRSVDLTRARLDGGIAPRTDVRQAEQVLETARSDIAAQTTALAQDVNQLELLVGAPVDPAMLPDSIESAAARVAPPPAGIDSGILLRRPDVVAAEYTLRAANAEIGAARAALFPRITLTGLLGFASSSLGTLFTADGLTKSLSGSGDYSIFRAGAGVANVRLSEAQRDAALASYEKAIQTAFREVADALARRGTMAEQVRADTARATAAADNYALADLRYRGGIDAFLSSLDAQRSLYAAQRTLVGTRLVEASNLVSLYRTLGGDQSLDKAPDDKRPVPATRP